MTEQNSKHTQLESNNTNIPTTIPHFFNPSSTPYPQSLDNSKVHSIISSNIPNSSLPNLLQYFQLYMPISKYFPPSQLKQLHESPNLKLKKYKESIYYGEILNNKKHGKGIMIYSDGRIYQGNWMGDYKHGEGYEKFGNQCVYEGQFVNGRPEGIGRYSWPNGEYYEGEWVNGMKHGSGMWRGAKGDSYIGEWKFGKADGYGVNTWINGDRYQGQFKQCLKHGEGIQKFANGDIYKGFYTNGKPSGFGQYYWSNGSYFKGQFINGLRDGQGMWKRGPGNSDKYQGQYSNDKKFGYGIFTWSTGNVYKGNYQSDVRNGYGQMYWNDGSYYKGQWRNGIQHGQGQIYVPGQGFKKGMFQDNVLVVLEKQSHHGFTSKTQIHADQVQSNQNGHANTQSYWHGHGHQHRQENISDPQKQSTVNGNRNDRNDEKAMPSKLSFRSRGFSSKNRTRQQKNIDENQILKNQTRNPSNAPSHPPSVNKTISYTHNYTNNPNHPLLQKHKPPQSRSRQQKYITIQRRNLKHVSQKQKERVLHSSFYMHKLHNGGAGGIAAGGSRSGYGQRANTSINGSKVDGELESGYEPSQDHHTYNQHQHQHQHQVNDYKSRSIVEQMKFFSRSKVEKMSRMPY